MPWNLAGHRGLPQTMSAPLCPNCFRPMILRGALPDVEGKPDANAYCKICEVGYFTEDAAPIAGRFKDIIKGD